jgi:hypothetical protein
VQSEQNAKKFIAAVAPGLNLKILKLRIQYRETLRPQIKFQVAV